jgi:hypothetical protein
MKTTPDLSPKTATIVLTKATIETREDLLARARVAESEARDLRKRADKLTAEIMGYIRQETGRKKKKVLDNVFGFRLAIEWVKGYVSWKDAFIGVAGEDKAKELAENAPMKESLDIVRL